MIRGFRTACLMTMLATALPANAFAQELATQSAPITQTESEIGNVDRGDARSDFKSQWDQFSVDLNTLSGDFEALSGRLDSIA